MKKKYIQPATNCCSVNMEAQILATSTITYGADTNNFDIKETIDDDTEEIAW